jgi:hypothetical protein
LPIIAPISAEMSPLRTRPGYKYDLHVHGTSWGAPVVVVEASEYRKPADRSDELRRPGNGLLVCESLVRTSLIVEPDELIRRRGVGDAPPRG